MDSGHEETSSTALPDNYTSLDKGLNNNTLKRELNMEILSESPIDKKVCIPQLQSVCGAEKVHDLDREGSTRNSSQVPDFSNEEIVAGTTQNPTEDANCSVLAWEALEPEVSLHYTEQSPFFDPSISEMINDPQFMSDIVSQEASGTQSQHCFAFGTIKTHFSSCLPNQAVDNTIKSISDAFCGSSSIQKSEKLDDSRREVQSATDNLSQQMRETYGDQTVSDFTDILDNDPNAALLSTNFGNIHLHSIGSLEKDTTITQQSSSTSDVVFEESDFNSAYLKLGEILSDIHEFEDVPEVDFGRELPTEFPEDGGLDIPTTVCDYSDEETFKKVKRSRRSKKKEESENTKLDNKLNKLKQKSIWTFLLDCLYDEKCNPQYIKWTDQQIGQFKIVNGPELAKKWSDGRNRHKLSYGHFARAMRYYYKKGDLHRVPGKKLMYEFGKQSGWQQYRPSAVV